jgi:hypothetical protein
LQRFFLKTSFLFTIASSAMAASPRHDCAHIFELDSVKQIQRKHRIPDDLLKRAIVLISDPDSDDHDLIKKIVELLETEGPFIERVIHTPFNIILDDFSESFGPEIASIKKDLNELGIKLIFTANSLSETAGYNLISGNISIELFTLSETWPILPAIVIHELVHAQESPKITLIGQSKMSKKEFVAKNLTALIRDEARAQSAGIMVELRAYRANRVLLDDLSPLAPIILSKFQQNLDPQEIEQFIFDVLMSIIASAELDYLSEYKKSWEDQLVNIYELISLASRSSNRAGDDMSPLDGMSLQVLMRKLARLQIIEPPYMKAFFKVGVQPDR